MRFFLIPLFFAMATADHGHQHATTCSPNCPRILSPQCGIAPECNFQAANNCWLEYEVCRRGEADMTIFDKIIDGDCPTDKPKCERLPMIAIQKA